MSAFVRYGMNADAGESPFFVGKPNEAAPNNVAVQSDKLIAMRMEIADLKIQIVNLSESFQCLRERMAALEKAEALRQKSAPQIVVGPYQQNLSGLVLGGVGPNCKHSEQSMVAQQSLSGLGGSQQAQSQIPARYTWDTSY